MPDDRQPYVLVVDTRVYRLLAIQKAAFLFTASHRVRLDNIDDDHLQVTLDLKMPAPLGCVRNANEFENELIDQELREAVGAETAAVRNLIIAQAFSVANLLDPVGETAEFADDPLQISRPDRSG